MTTASRTPLGRRLLAAAIDAALVLGIVGISILRERATPADGAFTFLGCAVAGVSWLVRDTGGGSPGKRLAGLVVVRAGGGRVDALTSAKRNAMQGAALVLSGAGTLYIADPGGQVAATFSMILGGLLGLASVADGVAVLFGDGRRLSDRWAETRVAGLGGRDAAPRPEPRRRVGLRDRV